MNTYTKIACLLTGLLTCQYALCQAQESTQYGITNRMNTDMTKVGTGSCAQSAVFPAVIKAQTLNDNPNNQLHVELVKPGTQCTAWYKVETTGKTTLCSLSIASSVEDGSYSFSHDQANYCSQVLNDTAYGFEAG